MGTNPLSLSRLSRLGGALAVLFVAPSAAAAAGPRGPSFVPRELLEPGPHGLLRWQWVALPALFAAAWIAGKVLDLATRRVLGGVVRRTENKWDDALLA